MPKVPEHEHKVYQITDIFGFVIAICCLSIVFSILIIGSLHDRDMNDYVPKSWLLNHTVCEEWKNVTVTECIYDMIKKGYSGEIEWFCSQLESPKICKTYRIEIPASELEEFV